MAYIDKRGLVDSHDNQKWLKHKYLNVNPGPYIGVVKYVEDPLRMGRLGVSIPTLNLVQDNKPDAGNIIWCQYLAPFYGAKSVRATSESDPYDYKTSQHSYGFWAVPPDIDTSVLVIFAQGDSNQSTAFWIGCIQDTLTNHMVPGNASTDQTSFSTKEVGDMGSGTAEKQSIYGADFLPAGEKNRRVFSYSEDVSNMSKWKYPINENLADQLKVQGLIQDPIRGTTTSSARRESPSQVFGINTPGRIIADSRTPRIGLNNSEVSTDRNSGHSFVMDDGDINGFSQLIRFRTASGHQLLMHDSDGVVYIANASGNAYIEMDREGKVSVYAGPGGLHLRTEGDFNLHSDANVNIHAANSIRMSASGEIISSANMLLNLGEQGVLTASQNGGVRTFGQQGISSYTDGSQLHGAGQNVHLAGSQVHFNSVGASQAWGPKWMTKNEVGMEELELNDVKLYEQGSRILVHSDDLDPTNENDKTQIRQTKTTVHNLVTHEPMPRFRAFTSVGNRLWSNNPNESKAAEKLMNIPGTPEFIEHRNRNSTISSIKLGQYQADLEAYLKAKMGNSTNVKKAKKLAENFSHFYNKTYKLPIPINDVSTGDIKKQLSSQVVESITNKSLELFHSKILVNQSGKIFSLGDIDKKVSSTISGYTGNLSLNKSINKNLENIKVLKNFKKNILAGRVTGVTQVTSLAQKFGLIRPSNMPGNLSFTPSYVTKLASIRQSIGGVGRAVSSFFSKWSDIRLKEDIQLIGKSQSGVNIYRFKYKDTNGMYEGVMAQEVPWAAEISNNGYYKVDYSKLDVEFRRVN